MKELDEKKWEKFVVFGKKGFLRIATTDSSIDNGFKKTNGRSIVERSRL